MLRMFLAAGLAITASPAAAQSVTVTTGSWYEMQAVFPGKPTFTEQQTAAGKISIFKHNAEDGQYLLFSLPLNVSHRDDVGHGVKQFRDQMANNLKFTVSDERYEGDETSPWRYRYRLRFENGGEGQLRAGYSGSDLYLALVAYPSGKPAAGTEAFLASVKRR